MIRGEGTAIIQGVTPQEVFGPRGRSTLEDGGAGAARR